jgi:hypothetical protein
VLDVALPENRPFTYDWTPVWSIRNCGGGRGEPTAGGPVPSPWARTLPPSRDEGGHQTTVTRQRPSGSEPFSQRR